MGPTYGCAVIRTVQVVDVALDQTCLSCAELADHKNLIQMLFFVGGPALRVALNGKKRYQPLTDCLTNTTSLTMVVAESVSLSGFINLKGKSIEQAVKL